MKKQFLAIALLCAVAALAGCSEQAMDTPEVPQQSQQALELNATIVPYQAEEGTRTAISDKGKVNWVDGDSLYVTQFYKDGEILLNPDYLYIYKQGKFVYKNNKSMPTLKGSEDNYFVAMNHVEPQDKQIGYTNAFMPEVDADKVLTSFALECPMGIGDIIVNGLEPDKALGERDLLVGSIAVSPESGTQNIKLPMQHLLTLMEFRIKNSLGTPFTLKDFTIETPEGVNIVGSLQPKYVRSEEGNFVLDSMSTYHRDGVAEWVEGNIHKVSVRHATEVSSNNGIYTVRTLLKPFNLKADDPVKITIRTTAGTFSKTYTIKADHQFQAAHLSQTAVEVTSDGFTPIDPNDLQFESAALANAVDQNNDGKVTKAEAEAAETIVVDFEGSQDASMEGIDQLVNLKNLTIKRANYLKSLNLTANSKLETVTIDDDYRLTTLEVNGLSSLKSLVFQTGKYDQIASYPLASLDLTGCTNLETLICPAHILTSVNLAGVNKLRELNLSWNLLKSIDLSDRTDLQKVNLSYNYFTKILLENMPYLTDVELDENPDMEILSLAGSPNIINLKLYRTYTLKTLDMSALTKLQTLTFSSDVIETLDLTHSKKLQTLKITGCTNLNSLNISGLTELQSISIESCTKLGSLDLSGCSKLTHFSSSYCSLNSLTLTGCGALSELVSLSDNFTTVDISSCSPDLGKDDAHSLYFGDINNLTTLYVRPGFDRNASGVSLPSNTTVIEKEPAAQP